MLREHVKIVLDPGLKLMAVTTDLSRRKMIVTLVPNLGLAIGPDQSPKKMDVVLDQFHVIDPSLERLRKKVPEVRAGRGPRATKVLRRQINTTRFKNLFNAVDERAFFFSSLVSQF